MKKIDKKTTDSINKALNKKLSENHFSHEFNPENTKLDFICSKCNAKYDFDVMAIYFDSLHNKEKFLSNPVCPYCGEREDYNFQEKTLHFLSYLYKNNLMKNALFQEQYIKELVSLYPDKKLADISSLDDMGLEALERGEYPEVFRIFTQFIYINPNHHLGFEFIAYAYYENMEFDRALYFIEKALERASLLNSQNQLDKGIFSVLNKNYEYMKRKQLIFRWWENL